MVPFSSLVITEKLMIRWQKINEERTKTFITRALKNACKIFRSQYRAFSVTHSFV